METLYCGFCGDLIHFWEDFACIKGEYFHTQVITLNSTLRCKRLNNKQLLSYERKLEREKK